MIFEHLDAVLSFAAVMLAASLVITAGTQLAIGLLGLRGATLRKTLASLFESACQDRDAKRYSTVIARRVLQQPLVSGSVFSRVGFRLDELPFLPADAAGKLRWAGSGIPLQPWLFGALAGCVGCPAALWMVDRLFSSDFCAYAGAVTRYIPFFDLCGHPWRSGAIIGAVLGGLLSRWRLASSIRLDELVDVLEKLSAPAGGTLPDPAQRAMLVIAGETRSRLRPKTIATPSQLERIFHDADDENDGGVAVAVERPITQVASHAEPKVEGLNLWFERGMERASQRFTVQARFITVVLSFVLVFAAHFDAIRLFHSLSSDAQSRAQLAASADAMIKQADQLGRGREGGGSQSAREGTRAVVPDVYRAAMAAILELPPAPEAAKPKPHHATHGSVTPAANASQPAARNRAIANEILIASIAPQALGEILPAQSAEQASPEKAAKPAESRASAAKAKSSSKEREKALPEPAEDTAIVAAKTRAAKALEAVPGFASREDAARWLRETLEGDPSLEYLGASYEQEVNAGLPSDADKLLDHSASIRRELARSGLQLIPDRWLGWTPMGNELSGLLIAVAFLSIGASLCYNLLKRIASLRPLPTVK